MRYYRLQGLCSIFLAVDRLASGKAMAKRNQV
jgi:hypothetical protein